MNVYPGDGRPKTAKKDCTVIAIAQAFEMPYPEAHALAEKKGRKEGKGIHPSVVLGLTHKKPNRVFKGRIIREHGRPGMTVGTFAKRKPVGRYIVIITGHAFAVIDGKIYNQTSKSQRVESYIRVQDISHKTK